MADNDYLRPEEAELAIEKASALNPKVKRARDRIAQIMGEDGRGAEILAQAIRRMLRSE